VDWSRCVSEKDASGALVLEVDWDGDEVLVGMDVLVDEGGGNRTGTVECIRG
jgi:hypothetical protein